VIGTTSTSDAFVVALRAPVCSWFQKHVTQTEIVGLSWFTKFGCFVFVESSPASATAGEWNILCKPLGTVAAGAVRIAWSFTRVALPMTRLTRKVSFEI
jgi:hypothetical protein